MPARTPGAGAALIGALFVGAMLTGAAHAESTFATVGDDPSSLRAILDLGSDAADDPRADAFFGALDAQDGKVVSLDLTVVPPACSLSDKNATCEGPGYALQASDGVRVVCGTKDDGGPDAAYVYGNVDNLDRRITLSLQHPVHFHAPLTVHLGDRLDFPFHALRCGVDGYTENAFTSLHLRGDFVVMRAEIPTATTYDLYPYNR